jgi:hypothetical protein
VDNLFGNVGAKPPEDLFILPFKLQNIAGPGEGAVDLAELFKTLQLNTPHIQEISNVYYYIGILGIYEMIYDEITDVKSAWRAYTPDSL